MTKLVDHLEHVHFICNHFQAIRLKKKSEIIGKYLADHPLIQLLDSAGKDRGTGWDPM